MMKKGRGGRIGKITGLGMVILVAGGICFAADPSPVPPPAHLTENGSKFFDWINGIKEHAEAQIGNDWIPPADVELIQREELEWPRLFEAALNLPEWVDFGIDQRTRFEVYDHPWRTSQAIRGGRTDPQILLRTRARLELGKGPLRFLFEGQDSRAYLNDEPGDFVNTTTVNEWDILQLLGAVSIEDLLVTGLRTDVHVGRMTLDFGSRRFIARNDFRNTTNAFDGVHWQIAYGANRFRAFLTEPVIRDDVQLDEQNKHFLFWGTYAESLHFPWFFMNVYYFGLNDKLAANVNNPRTFSTFGLRAYKTSKPGEMDYHLESTWQIGTRGTRDHFAHFQHAGLGYTFDIPWAPRLLLHYDYASGDSDPNDNQDGRFDTLFGARRFELMPTGIFGPFFRTNISSPGWRVIAIPAKEWRIQLKQRFWYLAQSEDEFGSSGLRDPTGGAGNYLGHDLEFRVQWDVTKNLAFDATYDHWFKGSYFDRLPASANLPAGGDKDTDYFYISMRFRL